MKDERGRHIDAATFARLLNEFGPHLVCSRVWLHYGSMLYFDMGALIELWTVRAEEEYIDDELFELRLPTGSGFLAGAIAG